MNWDEAGSFSAISEADTASSSGLSNSDIAIFCDSRTLRLVHGAEKILLERWDLTTSFSCRDCPAGRSKLANLFSFAKRSKLRVFLITEDLLKSDFDFHVRLLDNANVCSKRNCLLLLCEPSYARKIPPHLGDLTCLTMNGMTAGNIVEQIIEFRNEQGLHCLENLDRDVSTSDEALHTPIDLRSMENVKKELMGEYENEKMKFKQLFGMITKKRCYVLISSPIRECSPSLCNVSCVPWTRVFDFDSRSSTEGLYCWASEALSKRNLVKTTKPAEIETPIDDTINWVSMTGNADYSNDCGSPDMADGSVSQRAILRHCESLTNYCIGVKIPIILVMWYPPTNRLNKTLDDFLTGMRHHLEGRLGSFECIACVKNIPSRKTSLFGTLHRLGIIDNTIAVPVDILCDWMKECTDESTNLTSDFSKTLPKYSDESEEDAFVEIREQELLWIRSHVYVLVKSQPSQQEFEEMSESMKQLVTSFLKGSRIHWNVLESGYFDVSRDLLEDVKQYIEDKHISSGRSGVITIFHAPGGGGTTFARRLLYELRNKVPCGEIASERFALKNIDERLTFLRDATYLPTVLLLDGNSMRDVKKILAMEAKIVILIHVRRYIDEYGRNKANTGSGKYFLKATVSAEESINFARIYSHAAPAKSGHLQKLSKDTQRKKPHFIFEYGMTAFQSQFEGVRTYVHGYLQLNQSKEIQNWHIALLYLSLANYYGHRGLPCKLFSKLLDKRENELVELSDLPPAAQQFISEEDETWKITHYVVSKLIIEQVLVRRESTEYSCLDNALSSEACEKLPKWALRFIGYITEYVGVELVSRIYEIVTAIFICRNYDDPGATETGYRTHYSKIIDEIKNPQEQQNIFMKLVKSFPRQAEFGAHLGRFYSKQNKFDKADECFKTAIEVRKREMRGCDLTHARSPEMRKPDEEMQRIYNMSGFACLSNIKSHIGVHVGKLKYELLRGKSLPELIRFCLKKGSEGIKSFENGRLYHHKSSNPFFANIGELKVRLQLSELAKCIGEENLTSLLSRPSPYKELAEFALKSFHECDRLLAECISDRSREFEIPESEITFCLNNYNIFFKDATEALEKWAGNDCTIHSMKCHLSVLKSKLKQDSKGASGRKHFKLNEDVRNTKDILELVRLYEKICDSAWTYGLPMRVSGYMMEWLRAIRHPCMTKVYSQHDVLQMVEKWKKKKEVGSLCDFYCYVLCTTICISSKGRDLANVYATKSYKLKEAIKHNNDMPIYATGNSEWLGKMCDQDFHRLIHYTELGEWSGKFWNDSEKISHLQVCSGSIQHCRPHDGIITLDGNRDARITVFFVPNKYEISPFHSKRGTRVEFYLAFNTRHLAEAYEVTLLKTYPCPNCQLPTEISTLGKKADDVHSTCNSCESKVSPK